MKFRCTPTYDNHTFIYGGSVHADNAYESLSFVNCFEPDSRKVEQRNKLNEWVSCCEVGGIFNATNCMIERIE